MKIINDIAILEHDTHISKWVQEHKSLTHNHSLKEAVWGFLRPRDYVLEIGAFIGDNTDFLRQRVGNDGKVMSYEPNKMAFECLEYNAKKWDNVEVFNKGFGAEKGTKGIALSDNVGASHLVDGNEIEIITIDSFGWKVYEDRLNFIIMDCEGMEIDIIKGGIETIKSFKPTMVIEVNRHALERFGYTPKDLFDLLDSLGYLYRNIFDEPMQGEQYDIICF